MRPKGRACCVLIVTRRPRWCASNTRRSVAIIGANPPRRRDAARGTCWPFERLGRTHGFVNTCASSTAWREERLDHLHVDRPGQHPRVLRARARKRQSSPGLQERRRRTLARTFHASATRSGKRRMRSPRARSLREVEPVEGLNRDHCVGPGVRERGRFGGPAAIRKPASAPAAPRKRSAHVAVRLDGDHLPRPRSSSIAEDAGAGTDIPPPRRPAADPTAHHRPTSACGLAACSVMGLGARREAARSGCVMRRLSPTRIRPAGADRCNVAPWIRSRASTQESGTPAPRHSSVASLLIATDIFLTVSPGWCASAVIATLLQRTSLPPTSSVAGLRLPNVVQNLLGEGTLSASFIPVYSGLLGQGRARGQGASPALCSRYFARGPPARSRCSASRSRHCSAFTPGFEANGAS